MSAATVSKTAPELERSVEPDGATPSTSAIMTAPATASSSEPVSALRAKQLREAGANPGFAELICCPLRNLGNTCYFNSGTQLLANCPAFVYGLRKTPLMSRTYVKQADTLCRSGGAAGRAFLQEYSALLFDMARKELKPGEAISPHAALEALARVCPTFEGRAQQDCPEMICAALSAIEDEGDVVAEVDELLRAADGRADAAASQPTHSPVGAANSTSAAGGFAAVEDVSVAYSDPQGSDCVAAAAAAAATTCANDQSTAATVAAAAAGGQRSANFMAVYRLMQRVNQDNERVERQAKARAGKPYLGSFSPPRLLFNSITDSFKGYTLSEIRCHHCGEISRTVEPFTTLMLDLPSAARRRQYAREHPEVQRLGPDGEPLRHKKGGGFRWYNPLSYLSVLWGLLCSCLRVGHQLTLQECLDIHFEPAPLRGSNSYRCDSCGTTSEATKALSLLMLPEYLVVHIKRFSAGFMGGKKTDSVLFPLAWRQLPRGDDGQPALRPGDPRPEVLDLAQYLHPSVQSFAAPAPACLATPGVSRVAGDAGAGSDRRHAVTSYSLSCVVNHAGSSGGGHYTVYAQKETPQKNTWVYISDDEMEEATPSAVGDSEEYLLLYRKQRYASSPAAAALRNLARLLLLEAERSAANRPEGESEEEGAQAPVYVSRLWLHRAALLHEPGPIMNRLCYCGPAQRAKVAKYPGLFPADVAVPEQVPHAHGPPAAWLYVPASPADYAELHAAFGGEPALTRADVDAAIADQKRFLDAVHEARVKAGTR